VPPYRDSHFCKEASFVPIKNGGHTGIAKADLPESIPPSDIFRRIVAVFGPEQAALKQDQTEARPAAIANAA